MADFYAEMAAMVNDLLKPTSQGGLGQGLLQLGRKTTTPAGNEWDPPIDTVAPLETVKGAVRGVSADMVAASPIGPSGPIIKASDLSAVIAPPKGDYRTGDVFMIDGQPFDILTVTNIPPAGTLVAVRYVLRG